MGNGTTPNNNVQCQLKLKWACLIKHLADADIPNARIQMQGSVQIKASYQSVFTGMHLENIEKAIQMCKPKSEVVELCGLEHKQTT